ncbi:MAG: hypothetical protein JSV88_01455 [Candidatus Aminicenantes bacterium]|nr:MAG: hypothetical protein JSV88_01455 [Candidatus Aminicenantes bacterium]
MKKKILSFFLLLLLAISVFAVEVSELPELGRPNFIQVDGDELFVTDQYTVFIYSLNPVRLKNKFGRKGEGPGEFTTWPFVRVSRDSILCTTITRCLWFTRSGNLINEKRLDKLFMLMPAGENFIAIGMQTDIQKRTVTKILYLLNPKLGKVKTLYRVLADSPLVLGGDTGGEEYKMLYHYFGFLAHKNKIFVADSRKGLFIDVFNTNGEHLYPINHEIEEKVKVSESYKRKAMNVFKIVLPQYYEIKRKSSFTFYEYFPPMKQFWIDDNKIYVTTYKQKDDKNELIILDIKGNILKRLFLPFKSMQDWRIMGAVDPYTVHQGVLYELVENEDTEMWELHTTDLSSVKE